MKLLVKSEGAEDGALSPCWCELRTFGAIELEYNINLHSCNVIKAVLFQPVISIKGGDNSHDSLPTPLFSGLL